MHVVYVSSEAVPFAKTGGLADVAGALPRALAERGHEVSVILPFYRMVREKDFPFAPTGITVTVPMEGRQESGAVYSLPMEEGGTWYFVDHPEFFGEPEQLYGTPEGDYPNNAERFAFFCKVIPEFLRRLGEPVEIVHCNDWQSALLPAYLDLWYSGKHVFERMRSLITIHNLAYQGTFPAEQFPLTGLPDSLFVPYGGLEFYGNVNFLKGGLLFANALTTVSRGYAAEIQTEEFGAGLEGVLESRAGDLYGIPNGIDTNAWDPETDPHIAAHFSAKKPGGKKRCKKDLQRICSLPAEEGMPLAGMITRLADQKGLDLLVDVLRRVRRSRKFQLVLLGTGEERYHKILGAMQKRNKEWMSVHLRFDNALAHKIEAGADLFLMPSRYEPCGLNQLYSLRYGTVPVVRATGGLADTVVDSTPETMRDGTATGFRFDDYSVDAFAGALRRALDSYADGKTWRKLMRAGMAQDWSWNRSAGEYEELYEKLTGR